MNKHLANLLRSALLDRNWSQSQGAEAADISERMLKYIMASTSSPTLQTLTKIARGWEYPELFSDLGKQL